MYLNGAKNLLASYVLLTLPMILSLVIVVLKFVRSRKEGKGSFGNLQQTSAMETHASSSNLPELEIGTAVQQDELLSVSCGMQPEQLKNTQARSKVQEGSELRYHVPIARKCLIVRW